MTPLQASWASKPSQIENGKTQSLSEELESEARASAPSKMAEGASHQGTEHVEMKAYQVGSDTLTGKKRCMEDWMNQDSSLVVPLGPNKLLVGVFDGHGEQGQQVSASVGKLFAHFAEDLEKLTEAAPMEQVLPRQFANLFSLAQDGLRRGGLAECTAMKQVPKYLLIGDSSLYCKGISNRAKKQYVDKHLKDYSGGAFELTCCHCDGDGIEGIFQKLGKISGIFDKIFVSYFGNFLSEKDKQGGAEKKKEIFNKFFDLLKSKCPTQTIVWWVGGFSLKYGYKNGHIYDENMSKVREWIRRGGMECVTNFEMVAKFTMGNAEHVHSDNSEELCDFWLDVFNGKIHDRYRGVHPDSFDHKLADPLPTNARALSADAKHAGCLKFSDACRRLSISCNFHAVCTEATLPKFAG
eukprot:symbB.v1.2.035425.t1/scaffold4767.1/size38012/2